MDRAADDTFILAMRLMSEAAMQRRSAGHFSGDHRAELEARADGLRIEAMDLTLGIAVPSGRE